MDSDFLDKAVKRLCVVLRNTLVVWPNLTYEKMMKIHLSRLAFVCVLSATSFTVHGQDVVWPQFRGPQSNPVGTHARLAERWSRTENVEWSQEIPGRGWSSTTTRVPESPATT